MTFAPACEARPVGAAAAGPQIFDALLDVCLFGLVLLSGTGLLSHLGTVQSLTWLAAYGLMMARLLLSFRAIFDLVLRHWVLFLYPLYLTMTTLWSLDRSVTLAAGIQMTMTVLIAVYLGHRYAITAIMRLLLVFFAAGMVLSFAHWHAGIFPWSAFNWDGGLVGVYTSKNMLGQQAHLAVLLIVAIWLLPGPGLSMPMRLLATALMPLALLMLLMSLSMTSIVLLPVVVGLFCLLVIRRIPLGVGATALGLAVVALALGPLVLALMNTNLVDLVFDLTGKSRTLTGRTILWDIADRVSGEYPLLGVGFRAFWTSPAMANEHVLALQAGATSPSFHNFILELRVAGGIPALAVMAVFLAAILRRLVACYMATGGAGAAFALVATLAMIGFALLTPALARPHEYMLMLMIMFSVSASVAVPRRCYPRGGPAAS